MNTQRVAIGEQHPAAYKAHFALSTEVENDVAAAVLTPERVSAITWLATDRNDLNRFAITNRCHVAV